MTEYYYLENGAQQGPVDQQHLLGVLARLTRDTLVWRDGLAEWTAAVAVPELKPLLAPPPPPMPAAPPPPVVLPAAAPAPAYEAAAASAPIGGEAPAAYEAPAPSYATPIGYTIPTPPETSLNPFTVFGRTLSWTGKFSRGEFIVSVATNVAISLVLALVLGLAAALGARSAGAIAVAILVGLLVVIVLTVSGMGAVVRRVHDLGVSPWLMLLALVPFANFVWAIYLLVAPGRPDAPETQPVPVGPVATMLGIWALILLFTLVLLAFAVPAMMATKPTATTGSLLDVPAVVASVTEGLQSQLSLDMASVTCPPGDHAMKAGDAFDCIATPTVGGRLTVRVTQQDDHGNVKWTVATTEGLIDLLVVERAITQGLKDQASVEATVTCGGKYRASTPGDVFDCQFKTTDGRDSTAAVTIKDVQGHISWEVKP